MVTAWGGGAYSDDASTRRRGKSHVHVVVTARHVAGRGEDQQPGSSQSLGLRTSRPVAGKI